MLSGHGIPEILKPLLLEPIRCLLDSIESPARNLAKAKKQPNAHTARALFRQIFFMKTCLKLKITCPRDIKIVLSFYKNHLQVVLISWDYSFNKVSTNFFKIWRYEHKTSIVLWRFQKNVCSLVTKCTYKQIMYFFSQWQSPKFLFL